MSTFLVAVGANSTIQRLHTGFGQDPGPREHGQDRLLDRLPGRDVGVMAIADPRGLIRSGPGAGAVRLGWLIDHSERSIRIGAAAMDSGVRSPTATPPEGLFVDVRWDPDTFVVRRDAFAHYPVFWTELMSAVVISDSALALRRCRDMLGATSGPSDQTVVARSISLVVSTQHMSSRTPCREIRFLPAGSELCVDLRARRATAAPKARELVPALTSSDRTYRDELARGARELAGSLLALARAFPDRMLLSLSGGLDSRILLAALALEPDVLASVEITTGVEASQAADRAAVQTLAEKHGLSVNNTERAAARQQRAPHPFGHWALAALGTYDQVILRTYFSIAPMLNLGGQGGEGLRGGPGPGSIRSLRRIRPRRRGRALHREVRAGLDEIGVRAGDAHALRAHWFGYRSPLHAGLPVGQGAPFSHRPLNTRTLVTLAVAPSNPSPYPAEGSLNLATDLISVLGIDFARTPFVGSSRGIDYSTIRQRHVEGLGRVTVDAADLDRYRVVGHPDDLAIGAPAPLLGLVKDYRVPGATHDEQAHELALAAWRRLEPSHLSRWYRHHIDVVRLADAEGFPAERRRKFRVSAAKLLANDLWAN